MISPEKNIMKIQMVDVHSQYLKIKSEVDQGIQEVINSSIFIKGPKVKAFEQALEEYLGVRKVIGCANGTDALQIALMALNLEPGDEVIVPAFTYVATAEVIGLLGLQPVMVDVDPNTFNTTAELIEPLITDKTKVIVPVHLFGQCTDMEPILQLAKSRGIAVIEDNAQAIGADYTLRNGEVKKTGTMGDIGCTSFYPSKNLGCYGDGGAIFTNNEELGQRISMIANHGQAKKYYHSMIGCNSRLDAIQAAVLNVKLQYLDNYCASRQKVAAQYDAAFASIEGLQIPERQHNSTHVFHQYTLRVKNGRRDELKRYLAEKGIPSMIYYPVPLYQQEAFKQYVSEDFNLPITEKLCQEGLTVPIHTEMTSSTQAEIIEKVKGSIEYANGVMR